MLYGKLKNSPCYGCIPIEHIYFEDYDLFPLGEQNYITISKIKLWYGKAKDKNNYSNDKVILGI